MTYTQAMAIRTSIKELLQGTIGLNRVVPAGLFESGVFTGQAVTAQKVKALDERYKHRFDLSVSPIGPSQFTPLSVKSSYRLSVMRVEVLITTRLASQVNHDKREEQRARIAGDCDVAIAALNYPNNLLATLDARATGIVSGMVRGPDDAATPTWEILEENWEQQLLRSRIIGDVIVIQKQVAA